MKLQSSDDLNEISGFFREMEKERQSCCKPFTKRKCSLLHFLWEDTSGSELLPGGPPPTVSQIVFNLIQDSFSKRPERAKGHF